MTAIKTLVYVLVLILKETNSERRRTNTCENCRAPKFRIPPQNKTAALGESILLKCQARGNPSPIISWEKNESPITDGKRHVDVKNTVKTRVKSSGRTKSIISSLSIQGLFNKDFGVYRCVAKNVMGTAISEDAYVTLQAKGTIPESPHEIPGSSQYEDHHRRRRCEPYVNGSTCSVYLDPNRQRYTENVSKMQLTESILSIISDMFQSPGQSTFFSQKCRAHAMAFLCYYNFPYCAKNTDGKPEKMSVCRQDCMKLSRDYCRVEFQRAKDDESLNPVIPVTCNLLPTHNCISMQDENDRIRKQMLASYKGSTFYLSKNGEAGQRHVGTDVRVDTGDNCYFNKGELYRGVINRSESNQKCLDWSLILEGLPDHLTGHNYCRNPRMEKERPWCYVMDHYNRKRAEYCNVPQCATLIHPHVTSIWYTIIPCLVFSLVVSMAIITLAWRRHKQHFYQSTPGCPKQVVPRVSPKIMELNREDLCDFRFLGDANIGRVYSADYTGNKDGRTFTACVAVKAIIEKALPKQIEDFVREAETRATFKHENVIALMGVISKEEPLSLIYEYTEFGDLHEYLLRHSRNFSDAHANDDCEPLEYNDLIAIATQIAGGMSYLSTHAFVHKDLAARNCLVAENGIIKISDFSGLSDMYAGDYLRVPGHIPLPIRWMSPESLAQFNLSSDNVNFTSGSDMWSYGVVLWEIFSYGSRPYFGLSSSQCIQLILDCQLLTCPEGCPLTVYKIMSECWAKDPVNRSTFFEVYNKLKCFADATSHSLKSRDSIQPSAPSLHSHQSDFSRSNRSSLMQSRSSMGQQQQQQQRNQNYHSLPRDPRLDIYPPSEFQELSTIPRPYQPPPSFVSNYYPPSMNCPPTSAVCRPSLSSHTSSDGEGSACCYDSSYVSSHIYL